MITRNKIYSVCICLTVFTVFIAILSYSIGITKSEPPVYDTVLVDEYDSLALEKELERYRDPKTYEDNPEYSDEKMEEAEMMLDFDACYNRDPELRQRLQKRGFGFWDMEPSFDIEKPLWITERFLPKGFIYINHYQGNRLLYTEIKIEL